MGKKKRQIKFVFNDETHSMEMKGVSGKEIMLAYQDLTILIESKTGVSTETALAMAYAEQKRDKDAKDES